MFVNIVIRISDLLLEMQTNSHTYLIQATFSNAFVLLMSYI